MLDTAAGQVGAALRQGNQFNMNCENPDQLQCLQLQHHVLLEAAVLQSCSVIGVEEEGLHGWSKRRARPEWKEENSPQHNLWQGGGG
jgi:hypothetical protein